MNERLSFAACLNNWPCVAVDRSGSAIRVVMWMSCFRPIYAVLVDSRGCLESGGIG